MLFEELAYGLPLAAYQHLGQQGSSLMPSCLLPFTQSCPSCGQDPWGLAGSLLRREKCTKLKLFEFFIGEL